MLLQINEDILRKVVGLLTFLVLLGFLVGIYTGFFGGGWAALYSLLLIFGQTLLENAGTRKIVGLFMNIAALIVFILSRKVSFSHGLVMFTGAAGLGSYLGAGYALKRGNVWVRRLFVLVVSLSVIKLLFRT